MSSHLLDKLAQLKENEMKIKAEQKQLEEEIEFEIEKQRRLEMDGTITKLRTQVDELAKNIEGKIMPNNLEILQGVMHPTGKFYSDEKFITLDKFIDNLKNISEESKARHIMDNKTKRELVVIPPEIKIYNDIIPLFTTMIGIIQKQQDANR
jgi:hypothetical protein|tara:strand:- start:404 stop:859 length:456 start_codon:yes stop_codon:yes gene_type:complete